ncbi:hypothetical protein K3172_13000 [Qipengyuania sp. 6B39]|uniref:hypothetical protein n=1 Tax=Qipengyuania proteolytica TaxID=2867239 RepID=UPI001C8A024C|nr:hypothetical protein [Qipengyuania proteolytica]MBX7496777.1 hypothetical protein [Qipengyuania proteolytica]
MKELTETSTNFDLDDRFLRFANWALNAAHRLHSSKHEHEAAEQWDIFLEMFNRARHEVWRRAGDGDHRNAPVRQAIMQSDEIQYLHRARNSNAHRMDFKVEFGRFAAILDTKGRPARIMVDKESTRYEGVEGPISEVVWESRASIRCLDVQDDQGRLHAPPTQDGYLLAHTAIKKLVELAEAVAI